MSERIDPPRFSKPTCRGCYALGTACGRCEKCAWERSHGVVTCQTTTPVTDTSLDLTDVLAGLRRFSNISSNSVGEALGKSGSTVQRMENKISRFDLAEVQAYAEAIGVTLTVRVEGAGFTKEVPLYSTGRIRLGGGDA